jgi:hypothetical protein
MRDTTQSLRKCARRFPGAFAKFPKTTVTFGMPVRLSVRIEQLGSQWKDFREIWHLGIFRNLSTKTQVSLKFDKNGGYCK